MLLDIAKLPTAENSAIHLHPSDNVAVARVPIPADVELRIDGVTVLTRDAIPAGHKVALRPIAEGEMVRRYGQAIGRAKAYIEAGRHIHTHNLAFEELHLAYEFPVTEAPLPASRPARSDLPRLPARGRPCGDAQLHRGSGGQQLRGAYRRADRAELCGRNAAAECRRRGGVSPRRRLRPRHGAGRRPTAAHAGRSTGASQRFGGGDPGAGMRNQPDRSLPGSRMRPAATVWRE